MLSARSEVGIVVRSLFEDGRGDLDSLARSMWIRYGFGFGQQATQLDNASTDGKVTSQKCPGKCHHSATHHYPDPSHPETAQNDFQRRR